MLLQQQFEQLCECHSLSRSQAEVVLLSLAKAIWQEEFTPNLSCLTGMALRRGSYLIDFFSRVHLVSAPRQQYLRHTLEAVSPQLPRLPPSEGLPFYPEDSPGYDEIAHAWGLSNGIRPARVPGLLDLQRRVNFAIH
jgi:hypothetical protein